MRDVQVVLGRAAAGAPEAAIGHMRRVRVDEGIGSQSGREDVGAGLGDLPRLGPQLQVEPHDPIDRLVDRQPVGGARRLGSRPRSRVAR